MKSLSTLKEERRNANIFRSIFIAGGLTFATMEMFDHEAAGIKFYFEETAAIAGALYCHSLSRRYTEGIESLKILAGYPIGPR